jgi:asparagine N-glycosylation enzyme membrane subunit Stt3
MQDQSLAAASSRPFRSWCRDGLVAVALAAFLSFCWAARDWANLSQLVLPDPDDMMRLVQVRDWLNGQGVNDWTQYRMAPPAGAPMHWSRVNDAGLAAMILGFGPILGRHGAELVAVLLYPALLFAAHLILSARIARRIWGDQAGLIAAVLAAMAYPGTTVFAPGRIDHHALQVVLAEVAVLAATMRPRAGSGLLAGAMIALALVVGLEVVPQLAVLLGAIFVFWVVDGQAEQRRTAGLAIGLAAVTLPFVLFLRPTLWSPALCDAFTPATSTATFAGAAVLGVLAVATPRLDGWRLRLVLGGGLGGAVLAALLILYPACLAGPYGAVDPFLLREFIPHIDEANGIFEQVSIGRRIQLGGLMLASCLAVLWVIWCCRAAWRRWLPLAAVVTASGLITLLQVRGTYVGAPLGASLLAGVVLAARRRVPARPVLVAGAWLGASGMSWYGVPVVAEDLIARSGGPAKGYLTPTPPRAACNTGATWRAVDRYPPGVMMASTSVAAFLTGATRMSTVGAGYHRNNQGNMAMYRFFLSRPEEAARIARAWHVDYVAFCPRDFEEMNAVRRFPDSVVARLSAGRPPEGFQQLPLQGATLRLYRIAR